MCVFKSRKKLKKSAKTTYSIGIDERGREALGRFLHDFLWSAHEGDACVIGVL